MGDSKTHKFIKRGELWVWAAGALLTFTLGMIVFFLGLIAVRGGAAMWPRDLVQIHLPTGEDALGEVVDGAGALYRQAIPLQLKIGNRDIYGLDFRWFDPGSIESAAEPILAIALERREFGNFYGFVETIDAPNLGVEVHSPLLPDDLARTLAAVQHRLVEHEHLDKKISLLNRRIAILERKMKHADAAEKAPLVAEHGEKQIEFETLVTQLGEERERLAQNLLNVATVDGKKKSVPLPEVVRAYFPNAMSLSEKVFFLLSHWGELVAAQPRESNTEGGLFPAICGTVTLVLLMSFLSFPFGVLAGVYLREYARDGTVVRTVRIAVNNLAGIPSIVYGIFALGFFVYGVGGQLDQWFFADRLPEPTLGTGGILWAALTLGLLTLPVVIVATEEALAAIPNAVRDSASALGATQWQSLTRVLLPMASPGIMTGFILAMSRAAGEVAPLMITGVVKLAPDLNIDAIWPYVHLDRKFMHLGFHIYDISTQSPNIEAAKPMVYVSALLLIVVVVCLNSTAVFLRNRMRARYQVRGI